MKRFLDVRSMLYGMMFLMYFSLGSWAVTLTGYLMATGPEGGQAFDAGEVSWIYTTFALAGLMAPFLVGPLADRWFRAELVLSIGSFASAALLFSAAWYCEGVQDSARQVHLAQLDQDPAAISASAVVRSTAEAKVLPLFAVMLAYCFFMQLGLTLTNAITMRNHPNGSDGFSRTRMWGTIGWIVAGNVVGLLLNPISTQPLVLAGAAAAALGIFALFLPKTPPLNKEKKYLPALKLFRDRSFCVFVFVAFLATLFNQFYGVYAFKTFTDLGMKQASQIMTLGQVLEVGCMFIIPLLKPKKNLKLLMTIGLIGWLVRSAVMVLAGLPLMVAVAIPMHGWSFAFFFITAQTFVRSRAGDDLAAGAQGIVSFVNAGLGALAGNLLASYVIRHNHDGPIIDWQTVWVTPLVGCAATLVLFLILFRPHGKKAGPSDGEVLQV